MMNRAPMIERRAWLLGSLLPLAPLACAGPCEDDGLSQAACAQPATSDTDTATDGSEPASTGATEASGHDHGDGDGDGDGNDDADQSGGTGGSDTGPFDGTTGVGLSADGSSDDGPGEPWCLDADGDGFGDPARCSDVPGPGTVNNGDDCNDDDSGTFPGAAELEPDPTACTTDVDGDGWGDATPGEGAVAGADCWDDAPELNPSTLHVGSVDNGPLDDVAASIGEIDAMLSVIAPIETTLLGWHVTGAALRDNGELVAMEEVSGQLQRIDYQPVCDGTSEVGETTAFGPIMSELSLCGLSFDADDRLWAIDALGDAVLQLDPDSGALLATAPLTFEGAPLDLSDCGLTWDCHQQRLLLAHAAAGQVLTVDPESGQATLVATYDPDLGSAGIAYEPTNRFIWVSSGLQLNYVPLDGTPSSEVGTFNYEGVMVADVANLTPLRICE